jgi:hypothetical protein
MPSGVDTDGGVSNGVTLTCGALRTPAETVAMTVVIATSKKAVTITFFSIPHSAAHTQRSLIVISLTRSLRTLQ